MALPVTDRLNARERILEPGVTFLGDSLEGIRDPLLGNQALKMGPHGRKMSDRRVTRVDHSGEAVEIMGEQHVLLGQGDAISVAFLKRPGRGLQPVTDLLGKAPTDGCIVAHVPPQPTKNPQ